MGLALLLGVVGYFIGKGLWERQVPTDPREEARHLLRERKRLDQTVWAKEVLAQQYEGAAIALWDKLRAAQDKWSALENLVFEELVLGKPLKTEDLGWGILRTRYEGLGPVLKKKEWKAWLKTLRNQGFVFVQGELHHKKFDLEPVDGAKEARSVFSIVGHLRQPSSQRKLMVEGRVEVTWSSSKDVEGNFIPRSIKTLYIDLTEWKGPEVMEEVFVIEPGPSKQTNYPVAPLLVYDLDRDGDPDVLVPRFNELYWNQGDGQFVKARLFKDQSPMSLTAVFAAVVADFNSDGAADVFLFRRSSQPMLYWGRPDGSFATPATVVTIPGATWENPQAPTAGDIDGDGDLDVWIGQYKRPYWDGNMPTPYYDANDGYPSYLLVNQGGGRFTDATEQAGLARKRFRRNFSASLVDLDGDLDLDLITVNDFAGLDVYRNDGRGHFTDVSSSAVDERHCFGMAHTLGDYNLDGKLDLYIIGMSSTTANRLAYMNLGREEFPEVQTYRVKMGYGNRMLLGGKEPGHFTQAPWNDQVAATGWSWGAASFDLDTDGDVDLYVANGHVSGNTARDYCTVYWRHDIYTEGSPAARDQLFRVTLEGPRAAGVSWNPFEHNFLLMNHTAQGVPGFTNVAFLMGLAFEFDSRAVIGTDLNLDGRPDLMVIERDPAGYHNTSSPGGLNRGRVRVLENHWPHPGHWIGVHLREEPGQSAMGARILVSTPKGTQAAWIVSGDSFECQHPSSKLFGLGDTDQVDAIEVRWVNGVVTRLEHPEVDRYYYLRPPDKK